MITYVEANLFTSLAQTLTNTVNTVGVMGKGLAKTFKTVYPEMFSEYKCRCDRGELSVGRLMLYRTPHKWVLNFPTKRHWKGLSRVEDIEAGLRTFCQTYAEQGITSVAFPQLGCGNGGLDWETQVRPLMEHYLTPLPITAYVHIASGETNVLKDIDQDQLFRWLRSDPPSLSFEAFRQDLVVAVSSGRVGSWSAIGAPRALKVSDAALQTVLGSDDLFNLWRQLRSYGYLVPEDVATSLDIPAQPVFALLASLPYITRARVTRASSIVAYDGRSTHAMLDASEAQGVQLIAPRYMERHEAPWPVANEDDASCSAKQTTSQLALFSMS